MSYPYHVPEGYAEEEITAVIVESIASHLEFAQRRLSTYQLHCSDFEQRHIPVPCAYWTGRGGAEERSDRPVASHGSDRASNLAGVDLGLVCQSTGG